MKTWPFTGNATTPLVNGGRYTIFVLFYTATPNRIFLADSKGNSFWNFLAGGSPVSLGSVTMTDTANPPTLTAGSGSGVTNNQTGQVYTSSGDTFAFAGTATFPFSPPIFRVPVPKTWQIQTASSTQNYLVVEPESEDEELRLFAGY